MKRLTRLLNPVTWAKILASSVALYVNAIQLSEFADEWGRPAPALQSQWRERATMVAFEARQIRLHVGAIKEGEGP